MLEHHLYTVLLLLAAGVSAALAAVVWRRARAIPSGPPLLAFLFGSTFWSLSYALFWSPLPRPFPSFWLDVTFFGVAVVPTAVLLFAMRFANSNRLRGRRALALLAIEPVLTLACLWTDPGDGLFFAGSRAAADGAFETGGPVFWLHAAYSYALMLAAFLVLLREFFRASRLYRRQIGVFLLGVLWPWAFNVINLARLSPVPELDPTPFAFTITGVFLAYGLFRYQLLDVVPVARDALVERMTDGVLVLDARNRIVDANPAFGLIAGADHRQLIGLRPSQVLSGWPDVIERYRVPREVEDEILLPGEPPRYLDLRVALLHDRRGTATGRLVVLRDISDLKRHETALREANARLQEQVREITHLQEQLREQAIRDALTGLYNRRYLEETLARELSPATHHDRPLSAVLIDLDGFKQINDTCGHAMGDKVLQELGKLLLENTRAGDVVSRYGGEEFVVVLPGASPEQAYRRAEKWRALCERLHVLPYGSGLRTTFSAGIAGTRPGRATAEELLAAADRALYLAKQAGRDRSIICPAPEARPRDTLDAAVAVGGARS